MTCANMAPTKDEKPGTVRSQPSEGRIFPLFRLEFPKVAQLGAAHTFIIINKV